MLKISLPRPVQGVRYGRGAWGGWQLAQERWLLLNPALGGTAVGAGSPGRELCSPLRCSCACPVTRKGTRPAQRVTGPGEARHIRDPWSCLEAPKERARVCVPPWNSWACSWSTCRGTRRSVPEALLAFTAGFFATSKTGFVPAACEFLRWLP